MRSESDIYLLSNSSILGLENEGPDNDGPKLQDMTLMDLTLTDQNARVVIGGPDTDGPSSRGGHWRTTKQGEQWGTTFYGILNCPCLLFVVPHNQVHQCQILHFSVALFLGLANVKRTGFHFSWLTIQTYSASDRQWKADLSVTGGVVSSVRTLRPPLATRLHCNN